MNEQPNISTIDIPVAPKQELPEDVRILADILLDIYIENYLEQ